MPIEILMPALSPTMTSGTLAKWLKKEGDNIECGELIAEVETDKATMDLDSTEEGVLSKILVNEGKENVPINSLIAVIKEKGDTDEDITKFISNFTISGDDNNLTEESKVKLDNVSIIKKSKIKASPLAKILSKQNAITLENIPGSGPKGRIVKRDVLSFIEQSSKCNYVAEESNVEYILEPHNNIRKLVSTRLVESKSNIPHFYLSMDCNVTKLLSIRKEINDHMQHDPDLGDELPNKVSVNDLVVFVTSRVLSKHLNINSSWTHDGTKIFKNINISVAMSTDKGLFTPVITNANKKTLGTIAKEIKHLASKAKNNKIMPEDLAGGTFSISNLGMYGIKEFIPIINPPQSAILAIGGIFDTPVVHNNEVSIASMMNVSISCDHRVIDGVDAAKFMHSLKNYLENYIISLAVL